MCLPSSVTVGSTHEKASSGSLPCANALGWTETSLPSTFTVRGFQVASAMSSEKSGSATVTVGTTWAALLSVTDPSASVGSSSSPVATTLTDVAYEPESTLSLESEVTVASFAPDRRSESLAVVSLPATSETLTVAEERS